MLKNLVAQFAPTDDTRNQEIELEWQTLQTSWSKNIEIDKWLHDWEVTHNKMNGAFPVLQGVNEHGNIISEPKNNSDGLNDSKKSKLKCPCGSNHKNGRTIKYSSYLIPEAARNWKQSLDSERVKNVEARLFKDEDFRRLVAKWRKIYKPPTNLNEVISNKTPYSEGLGTPSTVALASIGKMGAFLVTDSTFQFSSSLTKPIYDLKRSWILDSAATVQVCNDISRFIEYKTSIRDDEFLWAGDTEIKINGYGTVSIRLESKEHQKGRLLTLKNVAFVPTLHTNVTILRLLNAVHVHWDTELSILKFNGRNFANTPMMFNQWVLEYNTIQPDAHVFTTSLEESSIPKCIPKIPHENSSRKKKV
ncbi:hypothetical protein GcC1_041016 [Golovinomyces cichoracearum]|uniref:Retrovirus-related Pol polyprotein from transposon TNT 1-94-like beta-barrel domain-containing protein n=1 Tax=Golovinomyces cichoracearum TaxID=62708 RepID=A0A420IZC7_9PEZI|nr:hypothetical protein GcC1_041016 [Golovinomyces cichoracearum]